MTMEIEFTKRPGSAKWHDRLRGVLIDALRAEATKSAGVIKAPSWPTVEEYIREEIGRASCRERV